MRRPPPLRDAIHFPATAGTMLLALAVTLAWWFGRIDAAPLIENVYVAHGQIWRLLTSVLLHADPFHLAFNLFWFWVFGTLIERTFGSARTAALFVLLAITSGAAEYAIYEGGIGLSGIGYGLFTLLWVLSRRDPAHRFDDVIVPQVVAAFVAWFVLCIGLTVTRVYPIANIAHAAGAALGALIGWAITVAPARRAYAYAITAAAALALLISATFARPYVNLSPGRGQTEAYLGYQALLHDDDRDAARWFRDATLMRPANSAYWFNRGIAESRLRHAGPALAAYQRAAALAPQNANYQDALTEMRTYVQQARASSQ